MQNQPLDPEDALLDREATGSGEGEVPTEGGDLERPEPEPPRIVVLFSREIRLRPDELSDDEVANRLPFWRELTHTYPGLRLTPVFDREDLSDLSSLVEEAHRNEANVGYLAPDFDAYHYVDAPADTNLDAVVRELLAQRDSVVEAYVDRPGPDPLVIATTNPRFPNQGYLKPAPFGVDAEYAWTRPGGDGFGQAIIDVEHGWKLDHEDLSSHAISVVFGTPQSTYAAHGSSVLGILCAADNGVGCVGIAPHVQQVRVVAFDANSTRPQAIKEAFQALTSGDVLLIEAQCYVVIGGELVLAPVEVNGIEFQLLRLATALGIIVVEAGGNGSETGGPPLDLDSYMDGLGRRVLDPASPDFRDSGAILVSAATSGIEEEPQHARLSYAPFGKRVDCYAWGENIVTLTLDPANPTAGYTTNFGGTSGASAIIAGVALVVQGWAEATTGLRLTPSALRSRLSNLALGTPPVSPEPIGSMPNLQLVLQT